MVTTTSTRSSRLSSPPARPGPRRNEHVYIQLPPRPPCRRRLLQVFWQGLAPSCCFSISLHVAQKDPFSQGSGRGRDKGRRSPCHHTVSDPRHSASLWPSHKEEEANNTSNDHKYLPPLLDCYYILDAAKRSSPMLQRLAVLLGRKHSGTCSTCHEPPRGMMTGRDHIPCHRRW